MTNADGQTVRPGPRTGRPDGGWPLAVRQTPQRAAVSSALDSAKGFRSAQELHDLLCSQGGPVGLTTVYRALQAFVEAGDVDVIQVGAETLYRRCSRSHHLHLVCRSCGTAVEIEAPTIAAWADAVAKAHDFRSPTHRVELFGLCPDCVRPTRQRTSSARPRPLMSA